MKSSQSKRSRSNHCIHSYILIPCTYFLKTKLYLNVLVEKVVYTRICQQISLFCVSEPETEIFKHLGDTYKFDAFVSFHSGIRHIYIPFAGKLVLSVS